MVVSPSPLCSFIFLPIAFLVCPIRFFVVELPLVVAFILIVLMVASSPTVVAAW
jgi:hypothetical protein